VAGVPELPDSGRFDTDRAPGDRIEVTLLALRDAAEAAFTPPPVERLRGAVRSRTRRRAGVVAVGVLVAAGLGAGTLTVADRGPDSTPRPAPTAASSSPPAPSSPPPSAAASGTGSTSAGASGPAPLDITTVQWDRARVTLPNVRSNGCPPGVTVTNVPGQESVVAGVRVEIGEPLAYGDLDGDGRPEAVLYVHCESRVEVDSGDGSGQLLVITVRDDRLVGLGYVGPAGQNYPAARVSGQHLTATVEQRYGNARQERTYRWNGQRFVQVAGPTAFPTPSS
jgi:hypothetical protein